MISKRSLPGLISGAVSIGLWLVLTLFNPYSGPVPTDTIIITFAMIALPACLAIIGALSGRPALLLAAFIWSLPVSLYLLMTPGIFALFGATCTLYLASFFMMLAIRSR